VCRSVNPSWELIVKKAAKGCFEISSTICPKPRGHIPEEWNAVRISYLSSRGFEILFCSLGRVSFPLCVYELGSVCSRTQLCHIGVFIDYIKQLHVSAFFGHLQVVLREQT